MVEEKHDDPNTILLKLHYPAPVLEIYNHLTQIHLQRKWMGHEVKKLPTGFIIIINLPLHQININIRIIEQVSNRRVVWLVRTEYIAEDSLTTISLESQDGGTNLTLKEVGKFTESRWTRAKEIHENIWVEMFQRFSKLF